MKKLFLILSLLIAICACGGGGGGGTGFIPSLPGVTPSSPSVPDSPSAPIVPDNTEPSADISSVALLKEGHTSVQSSNGYYTLLFNTNTSAANYSVTADNAAVKTALEDDFSEENGSADSDDLYKPLRDKEEYLLSSGLIQNSAYMRMGVSEIKVGTEWNNINLLYSDIKKANAKCIAISKYAYYFLQDGAEQPNSSILDEYINEFDNHIYPIMREKFGSENDTDSNGKIIILLFNANNAKIFGYFDSEDKYSASVMADSNEADVLYINANAIVSNKYDTFATMAHELQHMIFFDSRYNSGLKIDSSDRWINEGLSMQAEHYTGYIDKQSSPYIKYYLANHASLSLTEWTGNSYGYSLLYIRYLADRFGENIINKIYNTSYHGTEAIEDATQTGFNDLFKDYALALLISGRNISKDKKYNITSINLPSYGQLSSSKSGKGSIKPYSTKVEYFQGKINGLTLTGNVSGYGIGGDILK